MTAQWSKGVLGTFKQIGFQARAAWKRLTSTFKSEWMIGDYPINTQFHPPSEVSPTSRLKPFLWTATVINWPAMSGGGNTRQEALEDLRNRFEQRKATNKELPRPGTKVPIQFAARTRADRHAELVKDFIERILGLEWAWISDESSLSDFHEEETDEALVQKIRTTYGVDVSDISSGNLADIFDKIAASSTSL